MATNTHLLIVTPISAQILRLHESAAVIVDQPKISEEALAITTTRLPVVIVYVRQSIIWQGTWWFTV